MEKLVLRSVLWGADKVPDEWFEKIPGGFYKEDKSKNQQQQQQKKKTNRGSRNSSNSSSKGEGKRSDSSSNRRHSTSYDPRTDRDSGYKSDPALRRTVRNDKFMDGGVDDRNSQEYRRPRRNKGGGDVERRRSFDDNPGGSSDRYSNAPRDPRDANDPRAPYPRSSDNSSSDKDGRSRRGQDPYVYPARGAGTGNEQPMTSPRYPNSPTSLQQGAFLEATPPPPPGPPPQSSSSSNSQQQPTMAAPRSSNLAEGYVPYAHIYGGQPRSNAPPPLSPNAPPARARGGPNGFQPPVMPPPNHYQQNTNAQLAPTAADAGAGAAYTGQNSGGYYGANVADPWRGRRPPHPPSGGPPTGYDGSYSPRGPGSQSPPPELRDHSQQYDGHDGDHSPGARPVEEYDPRYDDRPSRGQARRADKPSRDSKTAKSKSRVREAFDTSQRGLGYGAVGALAGGIVGSEVGKKGKGILPVAIGAAVGALGANAFEARERRKEYTRHEQYSRDGTYDRAAAKWRADHGYTSE